MDALQQHAWPGNIRELENVVERAMIASTGDTLQLDEPREFDRAVPVPGAIPATWTTCSGCISRRCCRRATGESTAAETPPKRLGIHPNTLRFRMKKLGIQRPHPSVVRLPSRQSA